jgi:hypothetical protein
MWISGKIIFIEMKGTGGHVIPCHFPRKIFATEITEREKEKKGQAKKSTYILMPTDFVFLYALRG